MIMNIGSDDDDDESSLQRLDRLTLRYRRQEVLRNRHYQDLCTRTHPSCQLYQPSYPYQVIFIHRQTSPSILADLIHLASQTDYFTVDTQHQIEPYPWAQTSVPALIQIEFHTPRRTSSLVILIEVLYINASVKRQPRDFLQAQQIKQLCQMIFAPHKHIFMWGNPKEKLAAFYPTQLFDAHDLHQLHCYHIHDYFLSWYRLAYPNSKLHLTRRPTNSDYSLQSALFLVFQQWLNTRMQYASWHCGLDTTLKTYSMTSTKKQQQQKMNNYYQFIREEIDYRQQMQLYAVNNCFALTQFIYLLLQQWSLIRTGHFQPYDLMHYKRKKKQSTVV